MAATHELATGTRAGRLRRRRCRRSSVGAGTLLPLGEGVGVAELSRLVRTVRAWEPEVLAFHATSGCSNRPTEALILLIKKVKR